MSKAVANRIENHSGSGVDVIGLAKIEDSGKNICTAWVNFDGTTTPPTIRDSFNVSSVDKTASGLYTINFTSNYGSTNYSISGASSQGCFISVENTSSLNLEKVDIEVRSHAGTLTQNSYNSIDIFGGKA